MDGKFHTNNDGQITPWWIIGNICDQQTGSPIACFAALPQILQTRLCLKLMFNVSPKIEMILYHDNEKDRYMYVMKVPNMINYSQTFVIIILYSL